MIGLGADARRTFALSLLAIVVLGVGAGVLAWTARSRGPAEIPRSRAPTESPLSSTTPGATRAENLRGVSWVASRGRISSQDLDPVRQLGANWIAVMPFAFTSGTSPTVRFGGRRQFWGERAEGIEATVRFAREHGLRVMLKPHMWVAREGWAGDFAPDDDGWPEWESGYTAYILHFARLAETLDIELFAVGTEIDRTVRERPDFWLRLIRRVREVYHGPLTYAANWDDYRDLSVWGDLDYIGIDAYFPLSEASTPDSKRLEEAWVPVTERLEAFSERHHRPILFTEFGYRPVDGTAGPQWRLPPERGDPSVTPNPEAQAHAYEGLFAAVWDQPWFAGGFVWKWYARGAPRFRRSPTDYSPQGLPAEEVIRKWYGGPNTSIPYDGTWANHK